MNYAFIDSNGIVVNVISGALSPIEEKRLLTDYRALFGAETSVVVALEVRVWIGGSYDASSGVFSPPPIAEPEQLPEEIVNVNAPVE